MVKQIESLVGQYNKLAAERNMASMPYPSYGNIEVVSKSILLKDLATMKNAVEKIEEIEVEKVIRGVEFTIKTDSPNQIAYINGIWRYTLIIKTDDSRSFICVTYIGDETELDLNYNDMPFERIYTKDGPVNGYPVTNYHRMFFNKSSSLTSVTITGWTNKNVQRMSEMFVDCSSLTALNLSNFNTSQVTNMFGIFGSCSSIEALDLSGFNTSKVTNMGVMFYKCSSLTKLNLSNFNTSNVKDMFYMFQDCSSLIELDLSNWNTLSVTNTDDMFLGCSALTVATKNANIEKIKGIFPEGSKFVQSL